MERRPVPRLAYALAAIAASCLPFGLFLSEAARNDVAMPGPLTGAHAPLGDDCTACHSSSGAINHLLDGWSATRLEREESERCLACHELGATALLAHGRSPSADAAVARGEDQLPLALAAAAELGPPLSETGELGCQSCHHEHRGRMASLTAVADAGCQVCHTKRFTSFSDGHPEFTADSLTPSAGVEFDHRSHFERHFAEEPDAPSACSACHTQADDGYIDVVSFASACASCHIDDVRGAGQTESAGLAVLAVPALDVESLAAGGFDIAPWPADSMECETPLTPFMELLLHADPAGAQALRAVESIDLLDMLDAEEEDLAAAARLANAVRALFEEIAEGGHGALLDRISRALGKELDVDHQHGFVAGLPESLLRETERAWFGEEPGLDLRGDRSRETWPVAGGWYRRDADLTLRYRPGEHIDPLLFTWLELATANYGDPQSPLRRIYAELSLPESVGTCMNCHGVEAVGDALSIPWRTQRESGRLTRFSHEPHLPSREENACAQCHVLEPGEGPAASSGFQVPDRATCLECHADGKASDGCLTCHTYHATIPRPVDAPVEALLRARDPR